MAARRSRPALNEAYRKILPVNAAYKHIVLLTDGISEEGDSLGLSKDAANNQGHDFHGGPRAGCEPDVSREDRRGRERQIVLPERSRRVWNRSC